MAIRRKTDPKVSRTWFRSERMTENGGKWYFYTREGTIEGPFECRMSATDYLETYIRLADNDLLPGQGEPDRLTA